MLEISVITAVGPPVVKGAMEALEAGKNVVLPGGGISLKDEIDLKRAAIRRGLLLLGPGCGTSILDGKGFGIWNSVPRGPIGIIGTLGSGIQEVSCLIDKVGVSHALGVGFRDFSQSVGALGTLSAIEFLKADPATKVIVLLSRAPVTSVKRCLLGAAKGAGKPTVVCLLGDESRAATAAGVIQTKTLEDAATSAVALAKNSEPSLKIFSMKQDDIKKLAEAEYGQFGYGQKYVRGLYSGGALCTEALTVMGELVAPIHSNIPINLRLRMPDLFSSKGHVCIDFGADELAAGSDQALNLAPRCERILKEAKDWEAAVMLLDVILGHGAHADPAGEFASAVKAARDIVGRGGGYLSAVASIVGSPKDPQNLEQQRKKLENSGVIVMPSNAQAARMASIIATKGKAWSKLLKKT